MDGRWVGKPFGLQIAKAYAKGLLFAAVLFILIRATLVRDVYALQT
jgi:hypothetical protein